MRVTPDLRGGVRVLVCEGALTIGEEAETFEHALDQALGDAGRGLILDLRQVGFLDSAGVGSIVMSAKRGGELGIVVKIVLKPTGAVRRIFHVTQLEKAFELFDDVESAIATFP